LIILSPVIFSWLMGPRMKINGNLAKPTKN